ncbi:MAG: hypothetical protein H0T48_06675, partial [Gemmatimonadaceae bacterium]|nr:hypothetical protein [Gemmatimonadaceae bacterium]
MRDFIASQNSERLRRRLSRGLKVREPAAFAKLAQSTMDMALVTGIVARLYRAVILTRNGEDSGGYLVLFSIGAVFLLGMATLYLSRFPLREWLWRAPAFAALAGGFEMLTSLALIAANREPLGTAAARYADWPEMAAKAIAWRVVTLCVFALLLGGIVRWVRYTLLRRDHTAWAAGTVKAGIPGEDYIERRRAASAKLAFPAATTADRRRKQ